MAAIAAAAGERVFLPARRFAAVALLGLPAQQLFTSDSASARIVAMSRHQAGNHAFTQLFSASTVSCMPSLGSHVASLAIALQVTVQYVAKLNRECPTIAILPSGTMQPGDLEMIDRVSTMESKMLLCKCQAVSRGQLVTCVSFTGYCTYAPTITTSLGSGAHPAATIAAQRSALSDIECTEPCSIGQAGGSRGQVTAQEVDAASQLIFKVCTQKDFFLLLAPEILQASFMAVQNHAQKNN